MEKRGPGRPPKNKSSEPEHQNVATADMPVTEESKITVKDITTTKIYDAESKMTKPYWVGTLPDAPYHSFTLGGISFPVHTFLPAKNNDDHPTKLIGDVVELSDKQLNHVLERISAKVIRSVGVGNKKRYVLKDTRGNTKRAFIPSVDDVAVGRFVYIKEWTENTPRNTQPEPLIK